MISSPALVLLIACVYFRSVYQPFCHYVRNAEDVQTHNYPNCTPQIPTNTSPLPLTLYHKCGSIAQIKGAYYIIILLNLHTHFIWLVCTLFILFFTAHHTTLSINRYI